MQELINAPTVSIKKSIEFVEEHVVNGAVDFFNPTKEISINTGLKMKKKQKSAIILIKEGHQAFRTFLSNVTDLAEAFRYPLTTVPLSIATADNKL